MFNLYKITKEIEILNGKFDDYSNNGFELYIMCVDYIKKKLSSFPNNEIYLDQDTSPIGIWYYSNCIVTFKLVNRVYLIDGNIYADLDGSDFYDINGAQIIDLYNIAKKNRFNNRKVILVIMSIISKLTFKNNNRNCKRKYTL